MRLRRRDRCVMGWRMSLPDSPPASDPSLENRILDVLARAGRPSRDPPSTGDGIPSVGHGTPSGGHGTPSGGHGTLSAPEIAQAIERGGDWHSLLQPIRRAAVALAQSGRLIIYRKGKPADP